MTCYVQEEDRSIRLEICTGVVIVDIEGNKAFEIILDQIPALSMRVT